MKDLLYSLDQQPLHVHVVLLKMLIAGMCVKRNNHITLHADEKRKLDLPTSNVPLLSLYCEPFRLDQYHDIKSKDCLTEFQDNSV